MKTSKSARHAVTKGLAAVGVGAIVLHGLRFGIEAFGPTRPYRLQDGSHLPCDSEEFFCRTVYLTDAIAHRGARIAVLKNGPEFYPAELNAVDSAVHSINLEAYEFEEGDLTRELIKRLAARAKSGVQVRLLIDAIGSFKTRREYFRPLISAGGKMTWYHPIDWKEWPYFDHRTHRKLLTVDGETGFIGGAGFADHWVEAASGNLPWRDTVLQVNGSLVKSLNSTFAQNWVSSTGEILFDDAQFPADRAAGANPVGDKTAMVVMSSAGYGTSRARVLFQTLLESAQSTIQITSPYFLPDRSVRHALIRAVRDRGVKVQVLTAGKKIDHGSVRKLSEAMSASLIRAGVDLREYEPSMIHAKLMTIDGIWSVAGSTNFDHRSFSLNAEVNIAVFDREIAGCLERHFAEDWKRSRRLTPKQLSSNGLGAKMFAGASWVFRREQ